MGRYLTPDTNPNIESYVDENYKVHGFVNANNITSDSMKKRRAEVADNLPIMKDKVAGSIASMGISFILLSDFLQFSSGISMLLSGAAGMLVYTGRGESVMYKVYNKLKI